MISLAQLIHQQVYEEDLKISTMLWIVGCVCVCAQVPHTYTIESKKSGKDAGYDGISL